MDENAESKVEERTETNIVKNGSKAYGYNYSSLADMAKSGVNIPKMRIKPLDGAEYIEYLDDGGEWQLGARIVVPEMKGMNAAQAYGSALTYARRYTVQLAKSVACDDDSKIETQAPVNNRIGTRKPARIDVQQFKAEIGQLKTDDDIRRYYKLIRGSYQLTVAQQKLFESICADEIRRRQNAALAGANDKGDEES